MLLFFWCIFILYAVLARSDEPQTLPRHIVRISKCCNFSITSISLCVCHLGLWTHVPAVCSTPIFRKNSNIVPQNRSFWPKHSTIIYDTLCDLHFAKIPTVGYCPFAKSLACMSYQRIGSEGVLPRKNHQRKRRQLAASILRGSGPSG